jgi:hypothetical protein
MNNKLELRAFAPELRAAEGDKPSTLYGYAAVFDSPTEIGGQFTEVIAPGAFADTIQTDSIVGLINHDKNRLLGRNTSGTLTLREDTKGLYFELSIPNTTIANDLVVMIDRGDIDSCSFAFQSLKESWDYDQNIRTLQQVRLFDVSIVTDPAYTATSVAVRSAEDVLTERAAQEILASEQRDKTTEDAEANKGIDYTPLFDFLEVLKRW